MQLRTRRQCLKTIRDRTGSQCSSSRIDDEIELNFGILRICRAAAVRIDCRRSSRYEFIPYIALLQKLSREHTNACMRVRSAFRVNEWRSELRPRAHNREISNDVHDYMFTRNNFITCWKLTCRSQYSYTLNSVWTLWLLCGLAIYSEPDLPWGKWGSCPGPPPK